MDNLRKYLGKYVRLIDIEEEEFIGYVDDYTFPYDNLNNKADISISKTQDKRGGFYFYEDQIREIEILPEEKYKELIKNYNGR